MASSSKGKTKENEAAILQKFNHLRGEQRAIANKLAELDGDRTEHQLVLDALKEVDPDRKCFRMVGGVLAERTVKDVMPSLRHNLEQLGLVVKKLTDQLEDKGKELNQFREKHNIRIRGEPDLKTTRGDTTEENRGGEEPTSQGILVS